MKDIDEKIGDIYAEYFDGKITDDERQIAIDKLLTEVRADSVTEADKTIAAAKLAGYGNDAVQYRIDRDAGKL